MAHTDPSGPHQDGQHGSHDQASGAPIVVVIGGGYAGLACLIELKRCWPEAQCHLVDTSAWFTERTRLHETFKRSLDHFRIPFTDLAKRHNFVFHQAKVTQGLGQQQLLQYESKAEVPIAPVDGAEPELLKFDYLIVATGLRMQRPADWPPELNDLGALYQNEGRNLVHDFLHTFQGGTPKVAIIGAGATGVQCAFELKDALARKHRQCEVRLLDMADKPLPGQPDAVRDYAMRRLDTKGIEFIGSVKTGDLAGAKLQLLGEDGAHIKDIDANWAWFFGGLAAAEAPLDASATGQVILNDHPSQRIFACGDCAVYEGMDGGQQTAQAAFQQGQLIAKNLKAAADGQPLDGFEYDNKGYLVALGECDAAGWVWRHEWIVTGLPAATLKRLIEARDRAYIEGYLPSWDTPVSVLKRFAPSNFAQAA